MRAGREMDALVAEKVMQIAVFVDYATIRGQQMAISWWDAPKEDENAKPIPDYSTDIAAAWQVVEAPRLAELLEYVEVSVVRYHDRYECHIEDDTAARLYIAEADTAPHAICLAALKAVGVEL